MVWKSVVDSPPDVGVVVQCKYEREGKLYYFCGKADSHVVNDGVMLFWYDRPLHAIHTFGTHWKEIIDN